MKVNTKRKLNTLVKGVFKYSMLFSYGGMLYMIIELLFRGRTDYTMSFCGGLCFIIIGLINNLFSWNMPLILQGVIGGFLVVTPIEYLFGVLFNSDYHIWDYRNMIFTFDETGYTCLEFTLLWCLLSIVCVVLDDVLRYYIWGEDKPHYKIF